MLTVMIADDELFVREGLKTLIQWEKLGFCLIGDFDNGQSVIEAIEEKAPDVVILDIQMPRKTGLEVAAWIYEHHPQIYVILLTAYSQFQYAKEAIAYQVKDYIVKNDLLEELPLRLEQLSQEIKSQKAREIGKGLSLEEDSFYDVFNALVKKDIPLFESSLEDLRSRVDRLDESSRKSILLLLYSQMKDYLQIHSLSKDKVFLLKEEEIETLFLSEADQLPLMTWIYQSLERMMKKTIEVEQGEEQIIWKIKEYIDSHYMDKLSLEFLADYIHVNKFYLSRLFKEKTKENLFDYINAFRIKKAKYYIEHTHHKIYEIASMVGLEDTAYFSRVFKKYSGLSPSEYGKRVRKEE